MGWNGDLQYLFPGMLLQPDMATPLPYNYPAITPQGANDLIEREARYLAHTAISVISAFGL